MEERSGRERDLVLTQGEFAFVLDKTKGNVAVYVGPTKTSLSTTDQPVTYNERTLRFEQCLLEEAIRAFPFAAEGSYIVLQNPVKEGDDKHPNTGSNTLPKLTYGRKVNIPGPDTFPLWPGQTAEVVGGHHLRSNQYLLVRVYDEDSAKENWAKAVIKPHLTSALFKKFQRYIQISARIKHRLFTIGCPAGRLAVCLLEKSPTKAEV